MTTSSWKKQQVAIEFKAFTLIECLLSLMILSFLCLLFSALIKNVVVTTKYMENAEEKEWQVFLLQLENELKNCTYEFTTTNKIVFKNNKNKHSVWIENKLEKIVKVDNGGFQPLLINVKQATFCDMGNYVSIEVTFTNNRSYFGKWVIGKEHLDEKKISGLSFDDDIAFLFLV
ncbi:competence type IV pilus minor pilin ComGF [Enterococcus sp. LJL99]